MTALFSGTPSVAITYRRTASALQIQEGWNPSGPPVEGQPKPRLEIHDDFESEDHRDSQQFPNQSSEDRALEGGGVEDIAASNVTSKPPQSEDIEPRRHSHDDAFGPHWPQQMASAPLRFCNAITRTSLCRGSRPRTILAMMVSTPLTSKQVSKNVDA